MSSQRLEFVSKPSTHKGKLAVVIPRIDIIDKNHGNYQLGCFLERLQGHRSEQVVLKETMAKYVALLRGIAPTNPNMRNDRLRSVFEKLGFENIKTVISSGNVIFESPSRSISALEESIERALPEELGFSSTTIIRSRAQIQKLVHQNPFQGMEHSQSSSLNVTFLKRKTKTDLRFPHHVDNRDYTLLGMYDGAICSVIDLTSTKTPDL